MGKESSDKKIFDAIHGFIKFDEFEKALIDTEVFQRLYYLRQLGITYLVFPGATNTRFEHSLGVMELSSRIFKRLCNTIRPDIFHLVPRKGSFEYRYWKKILRIAALCHDIGHIPFTYEEDCKKWTLQILESKYLAPVWQKIQEKPGFQNHNVKEDVIRVAIGEEKLSKLRPDKPVVFSSWEKVISQIIKGSFFGANRIDYLLRDSKCTGIVYGLFDYIQLIEMLRILPDFSKNKEALVLGIDEHGLESCEALLLARHFMHKRVYQHPSVKAFNFHLKRFMKAIYKDRYKDLDSFLDFSDIDIIHDFIKAAKDKSHLAHEDANKIVHRKGHFRAILLEDKISKEEIQQFREKNSISEEELVLEFKEPYLIKKDLSFPVSRRNLEMQSATNCSSLLSNIPAFSNNWVYIDPKFEILFIKHFKK